MEWIYIFVKMRGRSSLEIALEKIKERLTICTFFQKQKQLNVYLIVSMDVLGVDRYPGADYK